MAARPVRLTLSRAEAAELLAILGDLLDDDPTAVDVPHVVARAIRTRLETAMWSSADRDTRRALRLVPPVED